MRDGAGTTPSFPPLLTGHKAPAGTDAWAHALQGAAARSFAAGDLIWAEDALRLDLALVAEPDVERARCGEMMLLMAVAFGDALGALAPPEVPITYRWPGDILVNGARAGQVRLAVSPEHTGGVPERLVVGLTCDIVGAGVEPSETGLTPDVTALWNEGCGELTAAELLESTARHLVNWIHRLGDSGFAPVHRVWTGRQDGSRPLAPGIDGRLVGLDEVGAALIDTGAGTHAVPVPDSWPR